MFKKNGHQGRLQHGQGHRFNRGPMRKGNIYANHQYEAKGSGKGGGYGYKNKVSQEFLDRIKEIGENVDSKMGFELFKEGPQKLGWLLNMLPTTVDRSANGKITSFAALELFFLQQDGSKFKAQVFHRPYFYVLVQDAKYLKECKTMLERKFLGLVDEVVSVEKEDLDLGNHLSGLKAECLQLLFRNVNDLMTVRMELQPAIQKNRDRMKSAHAMMDIEEGSLDLMECLIDLREYDVPYYTRVSIDLGINVGCWYMVNPLVSDGSDDTNRLGVEVEKQDILEKSEPRVLAFDLECTKEPLKFPNANQDQIFMISYIFDGQGFLIINREVVAEDIEDFEYTPKPEYPGPFQVFNEKDERASIIRFFEHCKELQPDIWVTYNGDSFDWPFLEERAKKYQLNMFEEIGVSLQLSSNSYRGRSAVHMDCFHWVQRDSYLPAGSRGLKAVTKAKLGYDPVEVDPEDMVKFAQEQPHHMASYSVSDAVATYYLFERYVNLFIFSLCTIIPMGPDDVLRKGSGLLCEMLLMVEAYRVNIICPNKQKDELRKYTEDGYLLESETYIGGHVECLETGVYRKDLPEKFRLDPSAFDELIANIDRDLTFAIEIENGIPRREVTNYDEVRSFIIEELELLRDTPTRIETPTIYHLDVAAMYPNIILTNRLQPSAMVDETACSACIFNTDENANCKRDLHWQWRGDLHQITRADARMIEHQLETETFEGMKYGMLSAAKREKIFRTRVKEYTSKILRRPKKEVERLRSATVCQRENPFYVNTVKAFRDRRYEYKGLTKKWGKEKSKLEQQMEADESSCDPLALDEARNKVLLYDSLQVAHKCILNSFYGYVMRKGSRWHSMEMAGIVTHTGGNIIKRARRLVERIGRPLELDTDGIWCILPASFPENFAFKTSSGKKLPISYPCVMLNADVHASFTNHQYQDLIEGTKMYDTHSECSIYFEVDGPYRCMVLPSSLEEGKLLKKRYAVFNDDGTLAELKGFELKRRGELKIIKIFQSQVFEKFLLGDSLEECYKAVAEIAEYWLNVLFTKGKDLTDEEVIELISENRSMSKDVDEYGAQKSTALSTARRLADFLGDDLIKNKGLSCKLLIAKKPAGAATTERAIPTAIFSTEDHVKKEFLRKWLKDRSIMDFDVRNIIDWDYYIERLGRVVQKIITIPAALQNVKNPVPSVPHPDWLAKSIREKLDPFKQQSIKDMFNKKNTMLGDIEDMFPPTSKRPKNSSSASSTSNERDNDAVDQDVVVAEDDSEPKRRRGPYDPPTTEEEEEDEQEERACAIQVFAEKNAKKAKNGEQPDSTKEEAALEAHLKFQRWMRARQRKWGKLREGFSEQQAIQLKHLRQGGISKVIEEQQKQSMDFRNGLGDLIQGKAFQIVNNSQSYWQVLEVRQLRIPGRYKVFVLTAPTKMETIYIDIPRMFYINSRRDDLATNVKLLPDGVTLEKVTGKKLPQGHPIHNLYRARVSEKIYHENAKELANFLCRPDHVGVYESQVPMTSRIVNALGCVTKVDQHVLKERLRSLNNKRHFGSNRNPFSMQDFAKLNETQYTYLDKETGVFRRLFCFNAGTGARQIVVMFEITELSLALFEKCGQLDLEEQIMLDHAENTIGNLKASPREAKCSIWISQERGGITRPNMRKYLDEFLAPLKQQMAETGFEFDFDLLETQIIPCPTVKACWSAFDSALQRFDNITSNFPMLVVMESSLEKSQVLDFAPALGAFPCVWPDAKKDDEQLPALQWEQYLCRRSLAQFFAHSTWLYTRIKCARYAHVPLAHIGEDIAVSIADMQFMHHLLYNAHVLWASPGSVPDLGGIENDRSHLDIVESLYQGVGGGSRAFISRPGTYRTVCAQIDVHHLAINTILHENILHAMECGGNGSLAFNQNRTIDNHGNLSATESFSDYRDQFKVMQMLVRNWYNHVIQTNSEIADALLVHFYRWLCSPKSLFYDPAFYNFVHQLMEKFFKYLLARLKELNVDVISASFQRIWIDTRKTSVQSGQVFIDHVLESIKKTEMLKDMHFELNQIWRSLIFMDEENYGAVYENVEYQEEKEAGPNIDEQKVELEGKEETADEQAQAADDEKEDSKQEQEEQEQEDDSKTKAYAKTKTGKKKGIIDDDDGDDDDEEEEQGKEKDAMMVEEEVEAKQRGDDEKSLEDDNEDDSASDSELPKKRRLLKKNKNKENFAKLDSSDDEDEEVSPENQGGRSLRRRAEDGRVVNRGNMKRKRELEKEKEYIRRLREGLDSDDDEEDDDDEARKKQDEDDMRNFIVHDNTDEFYEENDALAIEARQGFEEDEGPPQKYELQVNWNIVHHLPDDLRDYFTWVVGEFLLQPLKFRDAWLEQLKEQGSEEANALQEQLASFIDPPELTEAENRYLKKLVETDLVQKLLPLIPQIATVMNGPEWFPKLAGSHLKMKSPALEFVKMVCAVLDLDPKVRSQVQIARRSMLKLVHVGEFSDEAKYSNPSLVLNVQDLICSWCNYCTDLDICRNMDLMEEVGQNGEPLWRCKNCAHPYSLMSIESTLVERVQNIALGFQLQDVECTKCRQVRGDNTSESCPCSGSWDLTKSVKEQRHTLLPFLSAAKFYKFEWLEETVDTAMNKFLTT